MTTSLLLSLAFLPGLVAGFQEPVPADDGDSVLEVYDLGPTVPSYDRNSTWTQSLVVSPAGVREGLPAVKLHELHTAGSPEVVLDLITQVLGDELRYEGRSVALDGEKRLLVLAPPEVHATVREILNAVQSVVSATDQIQVDVLTGGELPASTVLEAAEAERLVSTEVARGAGHKSYVMRVGAGRTAALDLTRRVPFLFDYDVEIAQGSFMHDPIVAESQEGVRILLRGVSGPGGMGLSCVLLDVEHLTDVRSRPVNLRGGVGSPERGNLVAFDGPQALQTLDAMVTAMGFTSFLPDGKALVVSSAGELQDAVRNRTVILRRKGAGTRSLHVAPIAGTTRSLVFVNTELTSPSRLSVLTGPRVGDEAHPFVVTTLRSEPSLFLLDWLKYRFSVWRRVGPWAIIVTDPAWDGDAPDKLAKLVTDWNMEEQVLDVGVTLRAEGGKTPVRWQLPILAGTSCGAVLGVTGTALTDYDVEVAQYSTVSDPWVVATFDGMAFALGASLDGADRCTVDLRGTAQLLQGPLRTFEIKGPLMDFIEEPHYAYLQVAERASLARGEELLIGPAAGVSEQSGMRLEVRVR